MYTVPADLKARVEAKLREGIALAEAHYKQKFRFPQVSYALKGRVAGKAHYSRWLVEINGGLLVENPEEMVNVTTPHELAHLITDQVYPETHRSAINLTSYGFSRTKRQPHGPRWREVMAVLGADDSRTHSMDTTNVKQEKTLTRFEYKCSNCGHVLMLTAKRHNHLRIDPMCVWHRPCRGHKLELVGQVLKSNKQGVIDRKPAAKPVEIPVKTNLPGVQITRVVNQPTQMYGSKMEHCTAIFRANRNCSRAAMINLFVTEAHCTSAGAATYYATLKKKFG